jgi:ABC-2 type transport system ATP-binding protein
MRQRLGVAQALVGEAGALFLDEPANGLDPEGIAWIRSLMRALAAEGRTVFLSSHLMSEMEDTADRLVVIGRGRLVAETSVADFVASGTRAEVRVVAPRAGALADALILSGADVVRQDTQVLVVSGMPAARIGDLAAENGLALHELTTQRARLEDAFMQLTHDSVEYPGEAVRS